MSKNITPRDKDNFWHGYCEWCWVTGELMRKGVWFHGKKNGYVECYYKDGTINKFFTGYYSGHDKISNNKEAYCYIWNREEL